MGVTLPLAEMTVQEKLDLMEQLWADLRANGDWESPEWHEVILAKRLKGIEDGTEEILDLDEAWAELEERRRAKPSA